MKKYALVFLSVFLFISAPFAAHANIVTATGKYIINAVKHAPGGAKVHATNAVTGAKHVIKHGVSAPALGSAIGAGIVGSLIGGGVGIAFQAITGLALDAVDWVMDPANNQIKWKKKGDVDNGVGYVKDGYIAYDSKRTVVSSSAEMCALIAGPSATCSRFELRDNTVVGYFKTNGVGADNFYIFGERVVPYDPTGDLVYRNLSLDSLAAKTIEQADAGNAECQKTIEDYVTNLAKDGKLDTELDNATDITKPEGTEPDPDKDKECPLGTIKVDDICVKPSDSDPPLFCNSGEFTRKVCDWMDWTQEKPTESTEKPIEVKEVNAENSNKINMSGECPAPYELNFNVLGYAQNHSISYQPLCNALILLKPIFVGSGALSGMFILMGYSRASNTGVNG